MDPWLLIRPNADNFAHAVNCQITEFLSVSAATTDIAARDQTVKPERNAIRFWDLTPQR